MVLPRCDAALCGFAISATNDCQPLSEWFVTILRSSAYSKVVILCFTLSDVQRQRRQWRWQQPQRRDWAVGITNTQSELDAVEGRIDPENADYIEVSRLQVGFGHSWRKMPCLLRTANCHR